MTDLARRAKEASIKLAAANTEQKNRTLAQIAGSLEKHKEEIIRANREI